MISSTPRLKGRVELVMKAIITLSSTPDSASLISSASAPVGLIPAGKGFSVEIGLASASVSRAEGSVFVAWLDARCWLPTPESKAAAATPKPHLHVIRLFIARYDRLSIITKPVITF